MLGCAHHLGCVVVNDDTMIFSMMMCVLYMYMSVYMVLLVSLVESTCVDLQSYHRVAFMASSKSTSDASTHALPFAITHTLSLTHHTETSVGLSLSSNIHFLSVFFLPVFGVGGTLCSFDISLSLLTLIRLMYSMLIVFVVVVDLNLVLLYTTRGPESSLSALGKKRGVHKSTRGEGEKKRRHRRQVFYFPCALSPASPLPVYIKLASLFASAFAWASAAFSSRSICRCLIFSSFLRSSGASLDSFAISFLLALLSRFARFLSCFSRSFSTSCSSCVFWDQSLYTR